MDDDEKQNLLYSFYTPLRNHLRRANLESSLRAIHGHIIHQQFNKPLPTYIRNLPFGYNDSRTFLDFIKFHLFPWDLEIITKELIINAPIAGGPKSLEDWNYLARGINKLKDLDGEIAKLYIDKEHVLLELHRIAHRQFKWQINPNLDTVARYWKIYNCQKLQKIINQAIGLTLRDIFAISLGLQGFYMTKFALFYPPKIQIKGISNEILDQFLLHFSKDIDDLRELLIEEQGLNENFMYEFNSLRAFPLINMDYVGRKSLICPIPSLLYERLTTGIYYEIFNLPGFDEAFGECYQHYIGEVLQQGAKSVRVFPEQEYGSRRDRKRTVDWTISKGNWSLFIECKTKRLTLGAKINLYSTTELNNEIGKMADFIIQLYKNILDYENNLFPQFRFNRQIKIYPLVVTLEEWYLFGDKLLALLDEQLTLRFKREKLPDRLLSQYPYSVCSTNELEHLIQVIDVVGIEAVFSEKAKAKDYKMWTMMNFLSDKFGKELQSARKLFTAEFDKIVESWID